MERQELPPLVAGGGSKDGSGAGDNDQPYVFGRRPRAVAPWPFTERQYAHLLVLRGRVSDAPDPADRLEAHPIMFHEQSVMVASRPDLLERARQSRAA